MTDGSGFTCGTVGEAIAICHWNPHTCKLGGECAGKQAVPQISLARRRLCAVLCEEVAWLAVVGGEERRPQDSPCFLTWNKHLGKVH